MGYSFSRELLDQLKRCNLVKYFQSRFPTIPIRRSGEYYSACCPHPDHNDSNPSFRIHYDSKTGWYSWMCFGCHSGKKGEHTASGKKNYGSDAIAFVMWLSDYRGSKHILTFQEAALMLLKFFGLAVPEEKKTPLTKQEIWNRNLMSVFQQYFPGSYAERYAKERGLTQDTVRKFHLGTDGDRLAIPLLDHHHRLHGLMYRHLHGENPKYIHSSAREGFIKSKYLFGTEYLTSVEKRAFITEGVFDVMMANQYGLQNVLACLGTALTEDHVVMLKEHGIQEIVLAFDGDQAGQEATKRSVQLIRNQGLQCKIARLPDGMDLCDFAQKYKQEAADIINWYIVPDYEYELGTLADSYRNKKRQIQQEYMPAILRKALLFTNQEEYNAFRQYVFSEFDIRLEQEHVRKTQTNMEDPVSAKTAA